MAEAWAGAYRHDGYKSVTSWLQAPTAMTRFSKRNSSSSLKDSTSRPAASNMVTSCRLPKPHVAGASAKMIGLGRTPVLLSRCRSSAPLAILWAAGRRR